MEASLTPLSLSKFFRKNISLIRALTILGAYFAWIAVFRLFVLTIITYFVMSSSAQRPRFEEVSDAFGATELGIMGLGSFLFAALFALFNPVTSTSFREIFTPERFERKFLPGFTQGSVLALAVILAFLISGTYRYYGFFVHFDEAPVALANVVFRTLSLGAFVYCEEFLFRHKILGHFLRWRQQRGPEATGTAALLQHLALAGIVGILYCAVKSFQFEIGLMHWITFFLVSITLALRTLTEEDFAEGAGFWAALLIVFHPVLGLPIFGNEFSGLVLVKYQAAGNDTEGLSSTLRFFSGGPGGPISAFALQILILLDITRGVLRYKKRLLITPRSR